jgi:hypothetical protein
MPREFYPFALKAVLGKRFTEGNEENEGFKKK